MTRTLPMDYPLSKNDQDKALELAKKLLVLAKGYNSPAVTAMAGTIVIGLVVFVHDATKAKGNRK